MAFPQPLQALINETRSRDVSDTIRLTARRSPDKVALIYEGARDTFSGLNQLVDRTANALRARGVKAGDRVVVISHNNRTFVILRFAVARLGAVFAPLNFMLNASEMAYILAMSGAQAVFAEDALCSIVDAAITEAGLSPYVKAYISHMDVPSPEAWESADSWLAHDDTTSVRVVRDEDLPTQMMFTSGTESRPKGALLSSRALFSQYMSCIVNGGMEEDDIDLHSLPLYHCAQLDCFLTPDLYLGATSVLLRAPDPGRILEVIEAEGVTKLFCPPTVWISLLRHPDFGRRNISTLKKGYYGASVMPTVVIEELLDRIPGLRLYNFYGQTELSPVATVLKPEDQLRKLGSAGRAVINVETRIVDENDRDVPAHAIGEIVHRGAQVTNGYYRDEAKTAEAFAGGWFHSGDLGYIDEEGYLYVVDRKKDMIKSGGENVASREVEEQIFAHPKVSEVAVFGISHPRWIEAVTAVVVLRENADLSVDDLDAYCREKLASYKRPKHFAIVPELPKNASGKILKRELRDKYARVFDDGSDS
jgi:fatty-acyl-CoA synthase